MVCGQRHCSRPLAIISLLSPVVRGKHGHRARRRSAGLELRCSASGQHYSRTQRACSVQGARAGLRLLCRLFCRLLRLHRHRNAAGLTGRPLHPQHQRLRELAALRTASFSARRARSTMSCRKCMHPAARSAGRHQPGSRAAFVVGHGRAPGRACASLGRAIRSPQRPSSAARLPVASEVAAGTPQGSARRDLFALRQWARLSAGRLKNPAFPTGLASARTAGTMQPF